MTLSGSEEERFVRTVLGLWQVADTHCPSPSLLLQPRGEFRAVKDLGMGLAEPGGLRAQGWTSIPRENSLRLPNIGKSELEPGSKACPVL